MRSLSSATRSRSTIVSARGCATDRSPLFVVRSPSDNGQRTTDNGQRFFPQPRIFFPQFPQLRENFFRRKHFLFHMLAAAKKNRSAPLRDPKRGRTLHLVVAPDAPWQMST